MIQKAFEMIKLRTVTYLKKGVVIAALGKKYHERCFVCTVCGVDVTDSFYSLSGLDDNGSNIIITFFYSIFSMFIFHRLSSL